MTMQQHIFTVSELTASIRGMLESSFPFISVAGEISNLRKPRSGHIYFTLKDDRAQLKAVLFKMQQRYLKQKPMDGLMVLCRGRISVYEPRGDYQFIIDTLDFHGAGALQLAFEELKTKLAAEGLFAEERKKHLPPLPRHITLVTSPGGAAVHDFIRVAQGRYPQVQLAVYPVAVQGKQAAGEIAAAIKDINSNLKTDIIVLCRGGGSIEDLWAFNEERIAYAIRDSILPVVSAVGHEIDYTIADFTADLRAPTPSAAAELILPDSVVLRASIDAWHTRIVQTMSRILDRHGDRLELYRHRLGKTPQPLDTLFLKLDHISMALERETAAIIAAKQEQINNIAVRLERRNPRTELKLHQQTVEMLHRRLVLAGTALLEDRRKALQRAAGLLDAVSPLATLARGYSIVRKATPGGRIITEEKQVQAGDKVGVILHKGQLLCTVEQSSRSEKMALGNEQ